jgi:NADH:ubiquinone oxidoreductase subunit H
MGTLTYSAATLLLLAAWPEVEAVAVRVVRWRRGGNPPGASRVALPARLIGRLTPVPTLGGWLRFAAVLLALAPLPLTARLVAADLDAGLAFVLAAALLALAAAALDEPRRVVDRLPAVAVGGLTLGVATVPVIVRVASLNVSDIVIAQQGGLGNWFLWRDPFLLVATGSYVATAACLRPPAASGELDPAGPAAWTLISSAVGACLFLGGWWAFVPALDGAPAAHLATKIVALCVAQVWLRARLPRPDDPTAGEPPVRLLLLTALAGVAGSLVWLVLSGEVR